MIRSIQRHEIKVLQRLIQALADHEGRPEAATITTDQLDNLLFHDKLFEGLFLCCDEFPVGYALYSMSASSFTGQKRIDLEDYYVDVNYRNAGLGKEIMLHLVELALQRGCQSLQWGCLHTNHSGLSYYEHLGAKEDNSHQILYFDLETMLYLRRMKEGKL